MARNPNQGMQQIQRGPIMPNMNNMPHFNPVTAGLSSAGDAVKGLGNSFVNTAQVPYSAARVASANITGNKKALQNAHKALASDTSNNIAWNDAYRQTANELAGAAYAPTYNRRITQSNNQAGATIAKAYGNTPRAKLYGSLVAEAGKNQDLNRYLNDVGLTQDTSRLATGLRLGTPIVSAGAQTALQATGIGAGGQIAKEAAAQAAGKMTAKQIAKQAESKLVKNALGYGAANAGISTLAPIAAGDTNAADYAKAVTTGALSGMALPVLGAGAGKLAGTKAGQEVANALTAKTNALKTLPKLPNPANALKKVANLPESVAHEHLNTTDPYYASYQDQINTQQQAFNRNAANGMAPGHPTQVQLQKSMNQLGAKTADMRKAVLTNTRDKLLMRGDPAVAQGGYVRLPGDKPVPIETLPADVHPALEAKAVGPKRISPDRVPHQQLTPQAGIESLVNAQKATVNKGAQSWVDGASQVDELAKKYGNSLPARTAANLAKHPDLQKDFATYSWLKKYSVGSKDLPSMVQEFNHRAEQRGWNPTKESQYRQKVGQQYKDLVAKDISKGYRYPEEVLNHDPSFRKAIDARARYEKGLATSFSSDDHRIVFDDQGRVSGGLKRQDGKELSPAQKEEMVQGILQTQHHLGVNIDKLAKDNRWVFAHLNGKNPFLTKNAAGLYRGGKDHASVSVGGTETFTDRVAGKPVTKRVNTTMAHELGHAIDLHGDKRILDRETLWQLRNKYNDLGGTASRGSKYWNSEAEMTARAISQYVEVAEGNPAAYTKPGNWNKEIFDKHIKPAVEKGIAEKYPDYKITGKPNEPLTKSPAKLLPKAPAEATPAPKKIVSSEGSIAPEATPTIKVDKTPNGSYRAIDTSSDSGYGLSNRATGKTPEEAIANLKKKTAPTGTAPSTKPKPILPTAVVPTRKTLPKVSGEKPVGVSLPNGNVHDYLKQQLKVQEIARKQGQPTGVSKFRAGLADQKAKFIDSFSPIEDRLNQKITKENATTHITPKIDRALRADSIAGQYMKDNGLAKVIQSAPNTKELDQYLIAKHGPAFEREHGKGSSGRNLAADAQLVKELGPKYEAHAKAANAYSQKLLDQAVEYGLVSKQSAGALKAKYPDYVPMNRIFAEDELPKPPKGTGGGKASISSQSVVQKATGSQRAIESPLNSLVHKTQQVIEQGERNQAAQALIATKDMPDNPFNLRELKPSETVGTKPVVSYLDHGKVRRFETDKVISDAAKALTKQQLGLVGQILNVPVRVLRLGATSLNPAFVGANAIKDLASGAINSANPLRSSVANPHVFMQALKASLHHGGAEYGELVREGAGGTSFDIARNQPIKNVASIRAGRNVGTNIAYTVTHPAQLFRVAENTIGRSEEFSRALQYFGGKQAAEKAGATARQAAIMGAHAGRNNTVNFARAGTYGRVLNSVVPYLNAGAQGSRTLLRSLGDRPAQTTAKLAIIGFLPVATATAWNVSSPDRKAAYDDIKDYEKQNNIIIVPPNPQKDPKTGKWNVIKIPVSQEIANLNNVVRNGVEAATKDGSIKVGQILGDIAGSVTSLNLGTPRQAVGQVIPQAAKPVIESLTNQNLYTGNKIVPDSQKNLDGRDQYGDYTSGTAKTLGKVTNISPRKIDNFVRTSTGGLGQNAINASDNALAKAGVIKPEEIQGKSIPSSVTGRFAGAQGSSKYDIIDKQSATLTKQLKALPGYKNMNPADKAKALNRLTNAITGTYTTTKALTPKQQAIDNKSVNVADYLTPSTKSGGSTQATKDLYKSPDAEFKAVQASYNDKAKAGWNSPAQKIAADKELSRAKVGSKFDKSIRDAYNLSNTDLYNYVSNDPNGQAIVDKVLAYSQALKDAGVVSTVKFKNKYGQTTLGKTTVAKSTGGRRASTGRRRSTTSKSKLSFGNLKTPRINTKSKAFKTGSLKAPKFKSGHTSVPKVAKLKTPHVTVRKGVLA